MFTETANRKYQLWFNSDVTPNRQYLQYKNDKGSLVHKQCKYVHISVQTADNRRQKVGEVLWLFAVCR